MEYIEGDFFSNLNTDKGKFPTTVYKDFFIKLKFMWVDKNLDLLRFHYNALLFYFFFEDKVFINKIRQGRSNKKLFFIVEYDYKVVSYFFFNMFVFDFLKFFFYLKENFFGKNVFTLKKGLNSFFFRLYSFDLFYNQRLSEQIPLFFPNVKYPFDLSVNYYFLQQLNLKVFSRLV